MLWAAIVHLKLGQNILQCLDRRYTRRTWPGLVWRQWTVEEMMSVQICAGAGGCRVTNGELPVLPVTAANPGHLLPLQ